jgi:hypothetical protein
MIGKLVHQAFAGAQLLVRQGHSAADAADLSIEPPRGSNACWGRSNEEDVEPLMKRLEHLAEYTNATILAAASIVEGAIVMLFFGTQGWQGWIGVVFWIAVRAAVIDSVRTLWGLAQVSS